MQNISVKDLPANQEVVKGFYPTPKNIADKLLAGLDWKGMRNAHLGTPIHILEPSAGKGDLAWAAAKEAYNVLGYNNPYKIRIDAVEIDANLRAILSETFKDSEDMMFLIRDTEEKCRNLRYREGKTEDAENLEVVLRELKDESNILDNTSLYITGDDFLSFDTRQQYDLIVMNPPFDNGAEHLLRAIAIAEASGACEIRCVLNAETIRNPYTNQRRLLKAKLDELAARVSYVEDGFVSAERPTGVEVAIVRISVPAKENESKIFERLREAANVEDTVQDVRDLSVSDFLERIVTQFNVECDAGLELIREYKAMQPYILETFDPDDKYAKPTLSLRVKDKDTTDPNEYLKAVRAKYWKGLFSNKEFMGRLTSNLRDEYMQKVSSLKNYDFSLFNIRQIMLEMNARMNKGVEETIVALFDRMTEKHSWYPECEKNVHYFSGWKTNKVHKVNSKVILPVNGVFSTYSWEKDRFSVHAAYAVLSDIERVFDFLDGERTTSIDLHSVLNMASSIGNTKNIHCKYFRVTFYKKGTMHITFHDQAIVDRFNIYCCRHKSWLPPNYGNKRYSNMNAEEKAVIDGFHGNGEDGSGEEMYEKVMDQAGFYLMEPTQQMPMLDAPT